MKTYQNRCPRCIANKNCTCWLKGAIKIDNKDENTKVFEVFSERLQKDVVAEMPIEVAIKDAIEKVTTKFGVPITTELVPVPDFSKSHNEWTLKVKVG